MHAGNALVLPVHKLAVHICSSSIFHKLCESSLEIYQVFIRHVPEFREATEYFLPSGVMIMHDNGFPKYLESSSTFALVNGIVYYLVKPLITQEKGCKLE
jgi:hypothetical protein